MAKIKVHLLNFHFIHSHIEIVLEKPNFPLTHYYKIDRWKEQPADAWSLNHHKKFSNCIKAADSVYSFEIEADPEEIVKEWKKYFKEHSANILTNNCADAAQWFLHKFANIPTPSLANISGNHLAFGIVWPSFIPCPVTLPGRIMSNAKFYIEARANSQLAKQYSHLTLYMYMALAALVSTVSFLALVAAATILSSGLAAITVTICGAISIASTSSFFKTYNLLSVKNGIDELLVSQAPLPTPQA